uniref:Rho-class glutathione S-transferase n=1 Tax=Laternula elliptica TaxID=228457 RepID=B9VX79_LATEL|nr:rho-class glutathione S-transferase [Laternula elliptica]
MATTSKPFVYWGSGSPPCWKVLLVLQEKKIDYDEKIISFSKKEHKSEEILELNPRGQVPTFTDGDVVVNESTAICMYLEEKYPKVPLFPSDTTIRAKVYQRMFETSNISTNVMEFVQYKMKNKDSIDQVLLKEKKDKAHVELGHWENYLKQTGGFVATKEFTMADVFFFPMVALIVRQGANLKDSYPNIFKYYNMMMDRPTIVKTMPPHWAESDSPGNLLDLC